MNDSNGTPPAPTPKESNKKTHGNVPEEAGPENLNPPEMTANAQVIDFKSLNLAQAHSKKNKRLADMQESFENYLPINTESRQVKRRKARKKNKNKKK